MTNLTAVFELVDRISDKLDAIANKGSSTVDSFETMGDVADKSFNGVTSAAGGVVSAVSSYSNVVEGAAGTTDYWTEAVGNYDKSALEAVYSTEELVEMGLKSAEALEEERSVMELAQMATEDLNAALEASVNVHDECAEVMEKASQVAEELAENDKVSEQAKEALKEATEQASAAFEEFEVAQKAAQDAMDNYNAVAESGTATITELEAAALNAATAADKLVEANDKATSATEDLSKATEEASKEAENANNKGVRAIEGVASALAAAGITATLKEIAQASYELADAYSEASKIVVNATGATGDSLDGLGESMLNAYASNDDSLEDTAAAIGEINTRMGLTGDELTKVTQSFMDFADVTNGNAASSVRNVTQLMRQWNVPASEMCKLMDELTYAGQASGINVDTLSQQLTTNKAVLDQLGFSLEEATAMFMNFELAGTNSSAVMTGFRTALSNGDITSLEELNDVFEDIKSGSMSAAEASEMFGRRAGPAIVDAVNSGVMSIDDLVASLEGSEGVMDKTAEAGESLGEKWQKASNSIDTAFTKTVQPTLDGLSSGFADIVNSIGSFLNEHPVVVKAITALGVGIGVIVAGITGVTFVTTVAIPAVSAFGIALNTALGPIGWVSLAITGVVAAGTALVAMMDDGEDATERLTYAARKHEEKISSLNAQYDKAVEKYGASSKQAGELALEISRLENEYDNAGQTIGQFVEEISQTGEVISNIQTTYEDAVNSAEKLESSSYNLTSQLMVLSSQTDLTNADIEMMDGIVDKLNSSYEELGLTIDETTGKLNMSIPELYDYIQNKADEEKKAAATNALTDAIAEYGEARQKAQDALAESTAAWDNYEQLENRWKQEHPVLNNISGGIGAGWSKDVAKAYDDYEALSDASRTALNQYGALSTQIRDYCEQLGYSSEETDEFISELEKSADGLNGVGSSATEAADTVVSAEEAVAEGAKVVNSKIIELAQAYQDAYSAAVESFEGQFGLFDEASTKSEEYLNSTVSNAQKALDSQLAYWTSYTDNINTLREISATDLGITQENYDALMSYVQSGSEEAAGLAASMVAAIEAGNTEAVTELANTIGEVQSKQEEAASAVAQMQTELGDKMQEIEEEMTAAVEELNKSDEAATAASSTMDAYTQAIIKGGATAVSEARSIAQQISDALSNKPTVVTVPKSGNVPSYANASANKNATVVEESTEPTAGYANGTTNAEDIFIAGEEGPELIVGAGGSTVFPHSETEQIIDAMSKRNEAVTVVNEYEPTGFMDMLENAFSKLTGKMSALFEKLGGVTPTVELEGYATGTTSSEDSFIAGENGPELIVNKPDSTVFPADETDRIINAIGASSISIRAAGQQDGIFVPTGNDNGLIEDSGTEKDTSTRKILLEIAGKGNIELTGGKVDKETLLAFLYEYLKPVLSEILTQEIYEEGDMAYEY